MCRRTKEFWIMVGLPRHRHRFFNLPVQAPTQAYTFYGYSKTQPHFRSLLRRAWKYGGYILILSPKVPSEECFFFCIKLVRKYINTACCSWYIRPRSRLIGLFCAAQFNIIEQKQKLVRNYVTVAVTQIHFALSLAFNVFHSDNRIKRYYIIHCDTNVTINPGIKSQC